MGETEDLLRKIQRSLDEIKAILKLSNQEKLDQTKNTLLKVGSIRRQVYDLCDGTNTTKTIAQIIGKEDAHVRADLSVLRRVGLVRTVERDGKQVHEQIF